MKRRLWAFPLTILLATSMQAVLAEDEWEDLNKRGTQALRDDKYQEAEKLFLSARKEAAKSTSRYGHYATTLLNLGLLYDKMDRVQDSERAYKEALAIYEKSYGPSTAEDAKSLHGMAETYRHAKRYNESVPLFQRALKIRDVLIPTAPDTADTLTGLGDVYRKLNKTADALPLLKRALDIRTEVFGPTHPKTARALDYLSSAYASLGKYDMAVPVYKDLLSARQSALGVEDPKVAQVLEDLAFACTKIDKPKKAESSYKQALAIREKNAKADPEALANCIKHYGDFLKSAGREDEAVKLEAGKAAAGKTASK